MRHPACAIFRAAGLAAGLLLLLVSVANAQAPAWGEPRVADQLVSVRLKPDARSPLVRVLNPGQPVKVDFLNPAGWCALFDMNEPLRDVTKAIGYAECSQLKATGKAAPAAAAPVSRAAAPVAVKDNAGQLRQIEARTEVRKERNLSSAVTAVLAPGEQVQTGFASGGFVAVFRQNDPATREATAIGYIPEGMARPLAKAPAPAHKAAPAPEHKAEAKQAPAAEHKAEVRQATAQPSGKAPAPGQDPVRITSDRMVYNQAENSVVFSGNVHGTQTDMAIWANKITAYFADAKGKAKGSPAQDGAAGKGAGDFGDKIERIVAEGNVRLVAGKNEGACGQLTYYVQEGMLRMDQNPILREGQNTVRGDVIKYYLHEQRSEVLGGSQRRVEAIFVTPKGDKK